MELELADIFREYGLAYREKYSEKNGSFIARVNGLL